MEKIWEWRTNLPMIYKYNIICHIQGLQIISIIPRRKNSVNPSNPARPFPNTTQPNLTTVKFSFCLFPFYSYFTRRLLSPKPSRPFVFPAMSSNSLIYTYDTIRLLTNKNKMYGRPNIRVPFTVLCVDN